MHLSQIENRVYNHIFAITILSGKLIHQRTNIKITVPKLFMLLIILLTAASCNPTKYVPKGELLLNKNNLVFEEVTEPLPPTVTKKAMKPYIKQQPNKKIFGARFHLGLYNLSNIEKEKWPHGWLRRIGEEPVVFDPVAAARSAEQIKSYLWSKGFFKASVIDTVRVEKKEAVVDYNVSPGRPYTIADIRYDIQDSLLYSLVIIDTMNCMIKRGMIYDVDLLQNERQRLERFIRDRGFYAFSTEDIYFRVDSSLMNRQVNVFYVVSRMSSIDNKGRLVYSNHKMYRIRDVYVFPEFDPRMAVTQAGDYNLSIDTTYFRGIYYVAPPGRYLIKPEVISQSVYVTPGVLFTVSSSEQTQSRLADMKNHRLVNVTYVDVGNAGLARPNEGLLDCIIQLTPMQRQSFTIELEGTSTGGSPGGALNLIYQNKSLFRGAELFNLKLKGAYERLKIKEFKNTQEYGVEASLRLPKLLVPFPVNESFIRKHDPKTVLQGGYNWQKVPVYIRTVANVTAGYSWKGNKHTKHNFNPLSFDVVKLPFVNAEFKAMIDTTSYLAYSYRPVMVLGGNYDFIYNDQMVPKSKDYWIIRCGIDLAGNLLRLGYNIANAEKNKNDTTYHLMGQPFAQFVKGEVDASYHYKINEASSIVYRVFVGVGWPYGNSKNAMPFEEQYLGGGANDIRAWTVRTLGPGSYIVSDKSFLNQTADIKLVANAEYRFKLFWILEGAMFIDAGNIWTFRDDPDRPDGQFRFNKFLNDIAVGTGVGLRFDVKFVMLRADVGFKLRDPQSTGETRWRPLSGNYNRKDDMRLVIGIGYPF
jgi:hypothetical protein